MTTFNNLPLTEQLKALEPGDYVESNNGSRVKTDGWYNEAKGEILLNLSNDSTYLMHKRDVVRVVRPGEKREVPEGWRFESIELVMPLQGVPHYACRLTSFPEQHDDIYLTGATPAEALRAAIAKVKEVG